MKHFNFQLVDTATKAAIQTAGGKAYVAVNGDAQKVALFNKDGGSVANPVALVNGVVDFYVADAVNKVDLYIQAPSGHFIVTKGMEPSGPNSLFVDKSQAETLMVIPYAIADTAAATETNTGFVHPARAAVLPTPLVEVSTLDAGITIDVGTLSTDSGDADGFMDGVSVATAGIAKASTANGVNTLGVLLFVQDSANAGDRAPEANVSMQGKAITYTLSAGADTAEGFILLPVILPANSL